MAGMSDSVNPLTNSLSRLHKTHGRFETLYYAHVKSMVSIWVPGCGCHREMNTDLDHSSRQAKLHT